MKYGDKKLNQKGFSTLEMLMAMFVLLLALTAVITVSFGNQSMILDSQMNAEALNIAQGLLEKAQADSRKDFNLVNPVAETTEDGFTYRTEVVQKDYFTKLVTAYVDFPEDSGRHGETKLTAIVANFNNAVGGDTCSSVLYPSAEAWRSPEIKDTFDPSDFIDLVADGLGDDYPITDIDAYQSRLYVTANNPAAATSTEPTLFMFDIDTSDGANPKIEPVEDGFADNNEEVESGLNAVVVAEDPASSFDPKEIYAYVASNAGDQLQVIDVGVTPPVMVASVGVAGRAGNSIFYKNGFIYLGLKGSSVSGDNEFYIFDVHHPENPSWVGGSFNLGNSDINAIYVRDRYAYLATADDDNLTVLDISNAASPHRAGEGFTGSGSNNGKSIFMAGDTLYLGRTEGGTELSVLNMNDPEAVPFPLMTSRDNINISVDGLFIKGATQTTAAPEMNGLAFLLTKENFQVFDADQLGVTSTAPVITVDLPNNVNGDNEAVLDCEKDVFFVGSNDGDKGYLYLIAP